MKKSESNHTNPLSPDPQRPNLRRARRAAAALAAYRRRTGADPQDAISDLLTDLMHWCEQFGPAFPAELHRARSHYAAETAQPATTTAPRSAEL